VTGNLGLPATTYVVLGLVSIRPMTGYDLAGYAERTIGNFFPLTRSHIYRELDRLGRLGLLDATEVAQETAPTKRVYEINRAGNEELRRWLESGAVAEERTRNLFLVRIFFGHHSSAARIEALLDEYEAAARARRDWLAALAARLADRPGSVFRRSTAIYGVHHEEAKLAWVAEVRPMLIAAATAAELASRETKCSVR
jgi:PadR family transcriptional regulator, regulatory protein AphA